MDNDTLIQATPLVAESIPLAPIPVDEYNQSCYSVIAPDTSKPSYVKDWQYSQGYFDVVPTENAHEAMAVSEEDFQRFFKRRGYKQVYVSISVVVNYIAED